MRIIADRERCAGSGQCVLVEPQVFDQSDQDGRVVLNIDQFDPSRENEVRSAVLICPSGALSLTED